MLLLHLTNIIGTERIVEFLETNEKYENIINVQGDEPFLSRFN